MNYSSICNTIQPKLWDFQAGDLDTADQAAVQDHLRTCVECQAVSNSFARAKGMFGIYRPASRSASESDWHTVEILMSERRRSRAIAYRLSYSLGAAAIVLAGVLLYKNLNVRPDVSGHVKNPGDLVIHTLEFNPGGKFTNPIEREPPRVVYQRSEKPDKKTTRDAVPTGVANGQFEVKRDDNVTIGRHIVSLGTPFTVMNEMSDLNKDPAAVLAGWSAKPSDAFAAELDRIEKAVHVGDDFILVPRPQLASGGTSAGLPGNLIADTLSEYKRQKQIVDARLNRNVSMGVKSQSFEEFCKQLKEKSEIDIKASRSVADDKITLFCKDQSIREIMRQVNRVFGFTWARSGEEGAYQYTLVQDLRSQLAEEEMRNRDTNEAFVAIDDKIAGMNPDPKFVQWGALQMYRQLSPADYATLRSGGSIGFSGWGRAGSRSLPPEIDEQLVKANTPVLPQPSEVRYPDYHADLTFRVDRNELGQLTLQADTGVMKVGSGGFGGPSTLAVGLSPSVAKPENATSNKGVSNLPEMQNHVTLHPIPTCPTSAERLKKKENDENKWPADGKPQSLDRFNHGLVGVMHIVTADVWEEIHRKTGLPIIADSFTRLYRLENGTVDNLPLFDALNKVGDSLATRWKKEGPFIEFRSTSFFWDRMKEVPNRFLARWQEDGRAKTGLPLADFLEMSSLLDPQLDSHTVGDAVVHCWGIGEWDALDSAIGYYSARPFVRFLAGVNSDTRRKFMQPEGVAFSSLSPVVQEQFSTAARTLGRTGSFNINELPACRYRMEYIPAGVYVWRPDLDHKHQAEITVTDTTIEGALAQAKKIDPNATAAKIKRSPGSFAVIQYNANGEAALIAGVKSHLLFSAFGGND